MSPTAPKGPKRGTAAVPIGAPKRAATKVAVTKAAALKSAATKSVALKAAKASAIKGATATRRAPRTTDRPRRPARGPAPAEETLRRLMRAYPDARCTLDHANAFQLLVATILSAQSTDARVNIVTPSLFARYPTPADLAEASQEDVETLIHSTGFFRSKAKSIIGAARALVERHGGEVPATMDELTGLPGVGRKTANVVLGNVFGRSEGVVVDTHVSRVSQRLGWAVTDDAVKIEQRLMELVPRDRWTQLAHLLIDHGRAICQAREPRCEICPLNDLCPSSRV